MTVKERIIAANTTRNVGRTDRAVRALLPFVVLLLWWAEVLPTWAALPLGLFTLMLFPTAFTAACSIYYALGWSTCPVRPDRQDRAA
ncbi:YgaP family membrane protein [Aquipuribacter nitratireducens]|uniref:DUF2892 domain-containing protein n=1 Tax=Aquipuribacter nitratireducens TaxID=650104 RepID=A0ABW0GQ00_9MICO